MAAAALLGCASEPPAAAPAAANPDTTARPVQAAPSVVPPSATPVPPSPTITPPTPTAAPTATPINLPVPTRAGEDPTDQRTIAGLRARAYEGGPIEVGRVLADTPAYTSYFITYPSDGLRVTGYLNVPKGQGPFPVLIVNHGFVAPQGYVAVASNYTKREGDFLASRGYLTAGSDFRGHGNSPGTAVGTHLETAYVIDALNLIASLKTHPAADTSRLGVWGHSNGGSISERIMVVSKDVDATVIWAGVSSDATDAWLYLRDWLRRPERDVRAQYGHPDDLPDLYGLMGGRNYLADVVGPVQIHHGAADASVPYQHGVALDQALTALGRPHEFLTYPGAPHTFSGPTWDLAISRTLAFFDQHVRR
ncbi:MAG TPA: prolyl oligopeptidase family serine peptidase [Chloroflexota bacterium]|nr:prolyl oligopeptidase family serine peptidase [Chloroflexota bacterium]